MINLELSWQQAAAGTGVLAVTAVTLLRSAGPRLAAAGVVVRESALLLGLFALWQFAGSFALLGPGGAIGRARWLWHAERVMRLPDEASLQHAFLPHPLVVQAMNLYYDALHFPVLIGCLIWLFGWHRDRYRAIRTTLVACTALCLLIQLIPVAPPRMLPGTGMVDTAVQYGQSVYSTHAGFEADQLSAMPSVHVAWAILVAFAIITTVRTRWRWLAAAYPAVTTLVVVVTANHFWLDGIAAAAVLGVVLACQATVRRGLAGRGPADDPLPGSQGDGSGEVPDHAEAGQQHVGG